MTTENNEKLSLLDDVALKAQMLMANLKRALMMAMTILSPVPVKRA